MYIKDPVSKLPSIGQGRSQKYNKLNIFTVEDLLKFRPRTYLDLRNCEKIGEALGKPKGEKVAIWAKVLKTSVSRTKNKGIFVVHALLEDESSQINAIWFNQRYLKSFLKIGQEYLFYGQVAFDFSSRKKILSTPKILPQKDLYIIYPQTSGLSSRQISSSVKTAMQLGYRLEEHIPEFVLQGLNLLESDEAAKKMHFPNSDHDFNDAIYRFEFESLFEFICQNIISNQKEKKRRAKNISFRQDELKEVVGKIKFQLTDDQNKAIEEILKDMSLESPMNRILQGDVGSGKTIVALIASLFAIKNGYQVVYLAPTEILSDQHFKTAKNFFQDYGFSVELVTKSTSQENLHSDFIVGTHALLNRSLNFKKIGLVVIDEQHRFGVNQRAALIERSDAHLLSLSATPIPRTIAHSLFGNLSISKILTKPVGRKKIKTYVVPESKKNDTYLFVDKLIAQGQQVFVICPLIESQYDSDNLFDFDEIKSIERVMSDLERSCLGLRSIASLNGKMKQKDKEEIMKKFTAGEIDVLVSTSVVEVGIDVPGATVLIVEGADRFGLSQLHQFRGRVGRNNLQSYCFLFAQNLSNENTLNRLKAFVSTDDGFKLAMADLKFRGAGNLFGMEQSGFGGVDPRWLDDQKWLEKVATLAQKSVEKIDKYPLLDKKLKQQILTTHLE
ncbi:MAG: ATP-dependent DNA helicase RecG [candidate division WS2 bacterium ADurb.Bin280]|uniref:ATP-dependent DNA helicase RecG n=1 Tax=candidate division WS2 bacterium ADurb.Bin280 TaxID=1852829 RepID=A0A1V5SE94_9BACT|nr:MAG: ATP-dependent DNA helicase RecG [candidate division WS2 bacterium ADurb.Bin280]